MFQLRKALNNEAQTCYSFIEFARAYHKSLGIEPWHKDYPTLKTIKDDIKNGVGYVFTIGDKPLGYCCLIIGDEPAYKIIDGKWITNKKYAVIHRITFGEESLGKGLSKDAFHLLKEHCKENGIYAIRVDTQKENTVMQHILLREGFIYCGLITFDGGLKLAYEWDA